MDQQYYIYILSNFTRTVLYVGVTNNLIRRVYEHKNNLVKGFTEKYNVHDLIYFEVYNDIKTAIEQEKQTKNWSRKRKDKIIISTNPLLKDLYRELL